MTHADASNLSYSGRHARVQKARGRAAQYPCELCGADAKEWSQIHETDGTDPTHYRPLCFKCHRDYDGTTEMMWEANRGVPRPDHVKAAVGASARSRRGVKRPPLTDEHKAKISKIRKELGYGRGVPRSSETKEKIRQAALERWARRRESGS